MDKRFFRAFRPQRNALSESIDLARRDALRRLGGVALLPLLASSGWASLLASDDARADDSCSQVAANADDPSYSDKMAKVGSVISAGLSAIPEVGGVLNLLFSIFWPTPSDPQPDIWSEIKDKVQGLIDTSIDTLVESQMQQAVTGAHDALLGFQQLVQAYQAEPSPQMALLIQQSTFSTHELLLQQAPSFQPAGWQKQVLPYFAQFANMHLVFLRDVVWFGKENGLVDGVIDYFYQQFDIVVNRYCKHVDITLPGLFADYESKYQAARGNVDTIVCDPGGTFTDPSDYVRLASGAWKARKKQVQIHTSYTLMVKDFRDRWPTMLNRVDGAAPPLTRELFYGPYGIPELRDIGQCPGNNCVNQSYSLPQPYPDVPMPSPSPLTAMSWLHGNVEGGITNWLSAINVVRASDGGGQPNDNWVVDLRQKSITGITVQVAQYKWEDEETARYGAAGGHAVARLDFTFSDNTTQQVGNASVSGFPNSSKTTINYVANNIGLAPGHRASGFQSMSTVTTLYKKYAHDDNDGHVSQGSLVIGARLIDPDTPLPASLIPTIYVASVKTLTVDQAVDVVARSWANRGKPFSAEKLAAMKAAAHAAASSEKWSARRADFVARIKAAAKRAVKG
jgi:hypothetical protein